MLLMYRTYEFTNTNTQMNFIRRLSSAFGTEASDSREWNSHRMWGTTKLEISFSTAGSGALGP
jgi:hypothetical protein